MYIGLISDCLPDKSFEEFLQICKKLGVQKVELGVGNWSPAPHIDLDGLLGSEAKRDEMKGLLNDYGIGISAFNASGNPLAPDWGKQHDEVTRKAFRLCEYFDVHKVVMMSGLPGGGPEDHYPNWVVTSWPPETLEILDYQWNKVAIPYWHELPKVANAHGVTKLALEPHGCQLVHDVENFYRLKDACNGDPTIGFNLDPSHLFWQGADPIAVARRLGSDVYHVHIKDVRVEKPAEVNTLLDGKGVLEYAKRSWNFAIPGFGHDEKWWADFVVTLKMIGYDDVLSIENEDYTMDVMSALDRTVSLLKRVMV